MTPRYEAGDDVTPRYDGVSPRSEVRRYINMYIYVCVCVCVGVGVCAWACVHVCM